MTCPGGDKCLKCDVNPKHCDTINAAQKVSLRSVLACEVKFDEALKNMARRFPGKT